MIILYMCASSSAATLLHISLHLSWYMRIVFWFKYVSPSQFLLTKLFNAIINLIFGL